MKNCWVKSEKYMKIKFNSHDKLLWNKTIEIPSIIPFTIKNRTCYYFDDIIKVKAINVNVNNTLIDEKSYENILVYDNL